MTSLLVDFVQVVRQAFLLLASFVLEFVSSLKEKVHEQEKDCALLLLLLLVYG
jgi:hypothetical protein